jgi:hypothetical protein
MPPLTSVYVLGPALALGLVVVLAVVLRWIFSDAWHSTVPAAPAMPAMPARPATPTGSPATPPLDNDYGLLRAAALVDDVDTGQSVRALLAAARVRATVATGTDGIVRVLVFPDEYARAVRLVSWVL